MRFLTESEVADLLRCSRSKIKRLRLEGRLAYMPGRPVLVEEETVARFVAEQTNAAAVKARPAPPKVSTEAEALAQLKADARARAYKKWLRRSMKST